MKWEQLSNGPGRVIDRRGQVPPKILDRSKFGKYMPSSTSKATASAHKLGLSNYGAPSIRSMGSRLGQTMPRSYKIPDRKSTRNNIKRFLNGS